MSNHKAGENPARRIPKDSHATTIDVGLVGPKARPKGVADGQQVNIPVPRLHRQRGFVERLDDLFSLWGECSRVSRRIREMRRDGAGGLERVH